ncbi:MAG: DUF1579 domain-containing protein [Phyllobacteriaceae bacterium]|nr:DUF1579 domain-containing protein [Phyllobacteriaceae bacterium]
MRRNLFLLIFLWWFVAASVHAAPCEGSVYRQFDFWLGNWTVKTPDGKEVASSRIEREYAGCVIRERYEAVSGYQGESLNIFDVRRRIWHQTWVDNTGTLAQLEGTLVDGKIVLEGQGASPSGEPRTNRITWMPYPDGTVRQHWEVKGADGTWKTAFDGRYHRK